MKKVSKFFMMAGLVLLLSLTLVGIASADVIQGRGWLDAEGSGYAKLMMTGQVEINGHGVGAVYIYGAELVRAEGSGKRTNLPGGGVVFRGHQGTIHISGEKMVVIMVGKEIDVTAHGKGRAVLRGTGTYETGRGLTGTWAADGTTIAVSEE